MTINFISPVQYCMLTASSPSPFLIKATRRAPAANSRTTPYQKLYRSSSLFTEVVIPFLPLASYLYNLLSSTLICLHFHSRILALFWLYTSNSFTDLYPSFCMLIFTLWLSRTSSIFGTLEGIFPCILIT